MTESVTTSASTRKPVQKRWWWPTFVVVAVLLSLVEMEQLGVLEWGSQLLERLQQVTCTGATC